jgi:diguanylate cyclase (GGDEF)-like protein/PAS domain S-box-containing protein
MFISMNMLKKINLAQVRPPSKENGTVALRKAWAFDQAMIGMALLDLEGRWIDVNARFCRMLGYPRSSLLSRSYETLTLADDLETSRQWMEKLRSGQVESVEFQKRYRCADGRIIWAEIHATLVHPGEQEMPFIISQALDITEQRATRDALDESEALLRVAVAGADLGMWHWQLASGDFLFNDRAHELLGYQKGEVAQNVDAIIELVHPNDREELAIALKPHLKAQRSRLDQIIRFRRSDGAYMWLLLRGQVTRRDEHGWALQVSGTIMDVTKWKELERRLTRLATTDGLTGLLNRRSGMTMMSHAIQASERTGEPMSIVLLDIDHFKAINDRLGHHVGDKVLKWLGAFFRDNLRSGDHAVRWGGEEFAIILPGTGIQGALSQAQRLFDSIGRISDDIDGLDELTASMGVTTRRDGESPDALIKRADALMYQAKSGGRNNIQSD